jgi:transketolase
MRDTLSQLLVDTARSDDRFLVLSGDHGYALFDALRSERPQQFVNVGVAEQNMIGVASGLAKVGFRPCVYGLAAFVPIRVLEQIKLDLCHTNAPVIMLGDGAGLVYSTLGVSHQCGEDIACLRPLPNISIYSPCDEYELTACWQEARQANGPCYIRIGKADRPCVHNKTLPNTDPAFTNVSYGKQSDRLIIASGSMASVATHFARHNDLPCVTVPRIQPMPQKLIALCYEFRHIAVIEEHVRAGGLYSALLESLFSSSAEHAVDRSLVHIGLAPAFTRHAGSYEHALGEHGLDDAAVYEQLKKWLTQTDDR